MPHSPSGVAQSPPIWEGGSGHREVLLPVRLLSCSQVCLVVLGKGPGSCSRTPGFPLEVPGLSASGFFKKLSFQVSSDPLASRHDCFDFCVTSPGNRGWFIQYKNQES